MTPRPLPPLTKPYAPTVRVDVALLGVMCEYYRAFQQADRTRMWDQVDALDTPEIYQLLMITMDLIRHPDATVALTGSMLQLHEDLIIRLGHVLDLHRDEPF